MNNNLSLTISHIIFLDRNQRYDIYEGKECNLIGVSVPVWMKKDKTSEPASEVFVKYKITTNSNKTIIKHNKEGYEISLCDLETLNDNDPDIKGLLDIKDGGSEWLAFKQNKKFKMKNNKNLNLVHFVQMKPLEELEEFFTT